MDASFSWSSFLIVTSSSADSNPAGPREAPGEGLFSGEDAVVDEEVGDVCLDVCPMSSSLRVEELSESLSSLSSSSSPLAELLADASGDGKIDEIESSPVLLEILLEIAGVPGKIPFSGERITTITT